MIAARIKIIATYPLLPLREYVAIFFFFFAEDGACEYKGQVEN